MYTNMPNICFVYVIIKTNYYRRYNCSLTFETRKYGSYKNKIRSSSTRMLHATAVSVNLTIGSSSCIIIDYGQYIKASATVRLYCNKRQYKYRHLHWMGKMPSYI